MTNVLFVTPDLDYGGAARQLTLLAEGLPRERFHARVCVLGGPAPWVETLRQAGVGVDVLGWKRPFDVAPFLALRRLLLSDRPAVLHAWGGPALAAVLLSGARGAGRLFASHALGGRGRPGWPVRWLLHRVDRVIAFGETDAQRYRKIALAADRIAVVAAAAGTGERGRDSAPRELSETESPSGRSRDPGRRILCLGPIEPRKGFRDAVWAFDILRYLHDDLRLVFAGDGPDRPRVEDFARAVRAWPSVRFAGRCGDLTPHLQGAVVVWVTGRGGGVGVALEAMAAGLPVVASRRPELAEIVVDGETGYLVPPGDKAALARQTRLLLDDPELARRFGEAARRRAAGQFSIGKLVEQCARLYEE
jgi:glycosyltransferase involved in cell wall biosynthesis